MSLYHAYCDESRQTHERYMTLGGMILPEARVAELESRIAAFRVQHKLYGEMKWGKVSKAKLLEYQRFIDLFFEFNRCGYAHFHCMILDTSKFDHAKFNDGDREKAFTNSIINSCCTASGKKFIVEPDVRILVRLDQRNSYYPLSELRGILNNGMGKKFGFGRSLFRTVEPRDSKLIGIMQMVDVLIGAIGYHKNCHHLRHDASPAKKSAAEYIAKESGRSLVYNTTKDVKRFTIWNIRLDKK